MIPFSWYIDDFYVPFGSVYDDQNSSFGLNLPLPDKMRGFPCPFQNTFSFYYDNKGLVTTENEYPELNNARFKFFSTMHMEKNGINKGMTIEDMPWLKTDNKRVFMVENMILADNSNVASMLTKRIYELNKTDDVAVVQGLSMSSGHDGINIVDKIEDIQRNDILENNFEDSKKSISINTKDLKYCGSDPDNTNVKIYSARLQEKFPKYMTTNMLNQDYKNIKVKDMEEKEYEPTYFDLFQKPWRYQIAFEGERELKLSTNAELPKQLQIEWTDKFRNIGIEILKFTHNEIIIETKTTKDKFMVLLDRFSKRWNCWIDNKHADIYKSNLTFKGIFVPKGQHEIKFIYRNLPIKVCAIIYAASYILGCMIIMPATVFARNPK